MQDMEKGKNNEWIPGKLLVGVPGMPNARQAVLKHFERRPCERRKNNQGGFEYHITCLPAETRKHFGFVEDDMSRETFIKTFENVVKDTEEKWCYGKASPDDEGRRTLPLLQVTMWLQALQQRYGTSVVVKAIESSGLLNGTCFVIEDSISELGGQ